MFYLFRVRTKDGFVYSNKDGADVSKLKVLTTNEVGPDYVVDFAN